MISVIKRLMAGDNDIVGKFAIAEQFWKKFFEAHRNDDVKKLGDALGQQQTMFESKLDWNRALAKEIMPYTAIAYLYDEQNGFADNRELAQRVVKAFERSMCSIEIKVDAKDAAQLFDLNEN